MKLRLESGYCLIVVLLMALCAGACGGEVTPTRVPEEVYQSVSAGSAFTCGLRLDGSIRCWGLNETNEVEGLLEAPEEGTFVAVASGYFGNCALRDDGRLKCWGRVDGGEKRRKKFRTVDMKDMDVCAIRDDGQAECWGADLGGLSQVPDGEFTALSAGYSYGCGIRPNGELDCWGDRASNLWADPPDGEFQAVSAAAIGMCGLRSGGELECWGPIQPARHPHRHEGTSNRAGGLLLLTLSTVNCLACGRARSLIGRRVVLQTTRNGTDTRPTLHAPPYTNECAPPSHITHPIASISARRPHVCRMRWPWNQQNA